MKKIMPIVLALAIIPTTAHAKVEMKKFPNCEALNEVYPHGVAKKKYEEKGGGLTGTPLINNKLYNLNKSRDRDKDKVACER